MDFTLHGVKFKYEDGVMYRLWDKKGRNYWRPKKLETDKDGYLKLSIYNNKTSKNYFLHRIVYWVHHPNWDIYDKVKVIDHIDRVKTNNDIVNLRLVTKQENNFNTEFKGYFYDKKRDAYTARIIVDRKNIYLGYFKNKGDAHQAYLDAKEIYHII